MDSVDQEAAFLLMSVGFILCAILFIQCGSPIEGNNRMNNIANTFNIIIVIYVALSLHILHSNYWGKGIICILLGYIAGKLIINHK